MFKGTIIEKIHWFLTIGARQYLLYLFYFLFRNPKIIIINFYILNKNKLIPYNYKFIFY